MPCNLVATGAQQQLRDLAAVCERLAGNMLSRLYQDSMLPQWRAEIDVRGCGVVLSVAVQHELGQLVLKRFLLLVLLLDKAATHLTAAFRTPLLFKLTSSIKSSRQVRTLGGSCSVQSSWRQLACHFPP